MRLHITLDDELVEELDRRAGTRQRSVHRSSGAPDLDDERRWDDVESAPSAPSPIRGTHGTTTRPHGARTT
nr:ribbon-helix-helix protein, CopG family [Candidatus Microthrix sp.]